MIDIDDVPPAALPNSVRAQQRDALVAVVARPRLTRAAWARPAVLLGVGAAVVATTAAGFATYTQFAPVTDHSLIRCYANTDQGLGSDFNGTDTVYLPTGPDDPAPSALEQCASLWRAGIINADSANADDPDRSVHPVPPLVVCVLPGGIAGVFPGDDSTCSSLKLSQ